MELTQIVDRKNEIRTLPAPAQFVRQRMAQAAEDLSRKGTMAAHVELCNEALNHFVPLLYECDADGVLANLDARTYRLLVPAPFGEHGHSKWGLRRWEARTLSRILRARLTNKRHVALLDYNMLTRTWHLNLTNYSTVEQAKVYLQHCAVKLAEWRNMVRR